MRFTGLILAATALLVSLPSISAGFHSDFTASPKNIKCTKPIVRREWRMLSIPERLTFIKHLRSLYEAKEGELSFMDKISFQHVKLNNYIHGEAAFFPWHRWMLKYVEIKLQQVSGDPNFAMPYWNTAFDSQGPDLSPVFGDEKHHFGRTGDPDFGDCVMTGGFAGVTPAYVDNREPEATYSPHCLRRSFYDGEGDRTGTLAAFLSLEAVMDGIKSSRKYRHLRAHLESAPHGLPHMLVRADFGRMVSPNDPLFWLHHADLDRMWYVWQNMKSANMNNYEDENCSLGDVLPGFDPIRVQDVMNSETQLCVTYEELDIKKITPPKNPKIKKIRFHRRDASSATAAAPAGGADQVLPVQVKVEPAKEEDTTPKPNDRTELVKLRDTVPLSEEWIAMNHLKKETVREQEAKYSKLVRALNKIPGFVSLSAYWNQPNKLAKLPSWQDLKVSFGNVRARVTPDSLANFNVTKSIDELKVKVRAALKTDRVTQNDKPEVQAKVEQVSAGGFDPKGWVTGLQTKFGYLKPGEWATKVKDSLDSAAHTIGGMFSAAKDKVKDKLGLNAKAPATPPTAAATAPPPKA